MKNAGPVAIGALFLGAALNPGPAGAGAWTQPKGGLYDRAAVNFYAAGQEFGPEGHRRDVPGGGRFTDLNLSNYAEYGATDRLTLIGSAAYKVLRSEDRERETTTWGVGDVDLAARYRFAQGPAGVLSGQALAKIPDAYDEGEELPLGNGQYDLEARVLFGRSLWPLVPGYAGLELGYRWRAGAPADEIRYLAEVGGDFTERLYGRAKLDGLYSRDDGDRSDESGNPTSTNNFDLGKLELTLGLRLTAAWSVEASWTPALYGQNTAAGATYAVALARQVR